MLIDEIECQNEHPYRVVRKRVQSSKSRFESIYREKLGPQMAWIDAIRSELPREGIFVEELTQIGYVSRFAFPSYGPRTFISTGYQGTLGWGIPTALGVADATRNVPVVSISGDGGALFGITELATAMMHNISLVMIVFVDDKFGNVRLFQKHDYHGRFIATNLESPDFVRLAKSFGVNGLRAATPEELRACLKTAFKSQEPCVIEVPVSEMPSPWEFVFMPRVRGN